MMYEEVVQYASSIEIRMNILKTKKKRGARQKTQKSLVNLPKDSFFQRSKKKRRKKFNFAVQKLAGILLSVLILLVLR